MGGHLFSVTYNADLGFLPRKLYTRSHPTSHDDNDVK